jgi:hypothetical protein
MLLVDVEIDFLPMGTTQLLVVTTVNGQPGREQHLSPDQRRIAIHLPQGASGPVGVRVYGMDAGECILTEGSLEAEVPTSFNRTEQHSIQMARPSEPKKCGFAAQNLGFEAPKPALLAVWGSDSNNVYVVGGGGNVPAADVVRRCSADGGTCFPLNLPTPGQYGHPNQSVWGSDAKHVFVVNSLGRVAHCGAEQSDCALMVPDGMSNNLISVWGTDAENVYAAGNGGTILRCQASSNRCTVLDTSSKPFFNGVWGSSAEYVYAAGGSVSSPSIGSVVRCRGSSRTCVTLQIAPSPSLSAVWGSDAEHVYVTGSNGTMLRCTAGSDVCTAINSGTTANLSSIWGDGGDQFFVAGDNVILRCQVSNDICVSLTPGLIKKFKAIWGSDANNVYVVGEGGSIVRCSADSNACTPLTSGVTADLHGVFGTDANNIYVVGNSGTILRRRL